ncbi:MAG: hypothetical protein NTZ71_06610, partial [Planctomycetota bacterium]|nr:hypothetical protein [Planctomycetota bacterium]
GFDSVRFGVMFLPAFRMSSRETWQIITCQKRLFDLNSNGLGVFSGTTQLVWSKLLPILTVCRKVRISLMPTGG